jgi:hypothetical protein
MPNEEDTPGFYKRDEGGVFTWPRAASGAMIWWAGLLISGVVQAELFNMDESVPYILSNGGRVRWDGGWDAMVVADSSCVRVNARGVFAKPSHWTPRNLSGSGWTESRECIPSRESLCTTANGSVFPSNTPRYDGSRGWAQAGCERSGDGRILDGAHGYDLSTCDVLDTGGDVVVCGRTVSFRRTAMGNVPYWLICILAVYMVRALSYSIVHRIQAQTEGGDETMTAFACACVLPIALVPGGDIGSVTVEEHLFFCVVCCYSVLYGILFVVYKATHGVQVDPPIYNLITGTLQVVACRLYCGAETPYNPVLIWAVGTRGMVKLMSNFDETTSVTTFVDSLMLSLMCVMGFGGNPLYLAGLFAVSLATADVFG